MVLDEEVVVLDGVGVGVEGADDDDDEEEEEEEELAGGVELLAGGVLELAGGVLELAGGVLELAGGVELLEGGAGGALLVGADVELSEGMGMLVVEQGTSTLEV